MQFAAESRICRNGGKQKRPAYHVLCDMYPACGTSCPQRMGNKRHPNGENSFLVDIPSGWDPRAKQQPARLIAYSANCVVRAALFKSRLP